MILSIYTDGGSRGNPGPAAIGMVFYINNKIFFKYREDIGHATNNIAEYTAVKTALEKIISNNLVISNHIDQVSFYSDSKLLVNQLNGKYKIKDSGIQNIIFIIRGLEMKLNIPVLYHHIRREQNTIADALVNNKLA
jgi:ribonuclease HI